MTRSAVGEGWEGEDWACLSGAGMSIRCDNLDHLRDPGEFVHHLLLKTTWPA